ncbi:MAG: hydrogenase maturation nickel metallochaperone HypA [Bacteroidota bacterium]|nr:hydrogenase maturation nickel metallochaperone HypA [Bacteroidota bacterium]
MHELSIVMSIIDIARHEVEEAQAMAVEEIELDIGSLSGVEMDALEFAWKQGVKRTVLEHAAMKVNNISAKAECMDCRTEFPIDHYYDACPVCKGHFLNIKQGKELRVKSLTVT